MVHLFPIVEVDDCLKGYHPLEKASCSLCVSSAAATLSSSISLGLYLQLWPRLVTKLRAFARNRLYKLRRGQKTPLTADGPVQPGQRFDVQPNHLHASLDRTSKGQALPVGE